MKNNRHKSFLYAIAVSFLISTWSAFAEQKPVLVVVGMATENKIVKGDGVVTVLSAGNGQQLRNELKKFDFSTVRAVVSFGIAGGLHPDLKPGNLVVATHVLADNVRRATSPEITAAIQTRLNYEGLTVRPMVFYGKDKVTTETNAEIRDRTKADVVDTESHIAAEFAEANNLPFGAVRAISDSVDFVLPPAALIPLLPNGEPDIGAVWESLFSQPWQFPLLIEVAFNTEKAYASLRKARIFFDENAPLPANRLVDRTTAPTQPASAAQKVAEFEFPPGHVTISKSGRVFMDALMSDKEAPYKVVELKDGKMVPFPSPALQKKYVAIHGVYVDHADRLWILDNGNRGFLHPPRLFGYDINTGKEIENYTFPYKVAGLGSMINDLVVDPTREKIYISETGPVFNNSAIVVFDIKKRTSRRLLDRHSSVSASKYHIFVEGKPFTVLGFIRPRFGIDGLALDATGKWLYYASFNSGILHRIPVNSLIDESLVKTQIESTVEKVANITMTDGIYVDAQQRVYLSDVEHSAVVRLNADGKLETILKHPEFRWPTGFVVSPDGWIYFTCNAIDQVTLRSRETVKDLGPYYMFRFRP